MIKGTEPLRQKVWQIRQAQIKAAVVNAVALLCASCRLNIMAGADAGQSQVRIDVNGKNGSRLTPIKSQSDLRATIAFYFEDCT